MVKLGEDGGVGEVFGGVVVHFFVMAKAGFGVAECVDKPCGGLELVDGTFGVDGVVKPPEGCSSKCGFLLVLAAGVVMGDLGVVHARIGIVSDGILTDIAEEDIGDLAELGFELEAFHLGGVACAISPRLGGTHVDGFYLGIGEGTVEADEGVRLFLPGDMAGGVYSVMFLNGIEDVFGDGIAKEA